MKTREEKIRERDQVNVLLAFTIASLILGVIVSLIFKSSLGNISLSITKLELVLSGKWIRVMIRSFVAGFWAMAAIFICGFGAIFQPFIYLILAFRGFGFGVAITRLMIAERPYLNLMAFLPLSISQLMLIILASKASLGLSAMYYFITVSNENRLGLKNQAGDYIHLFLKYTIILLLFCAIDCIYLRLIATAL